MPKKRDQKTERAKTVKRKAKHKISKWSNRDKQEILGIAEGIMADRSINMKEAPYFEAAKALLDDNHKPLFDRSYARIKHEYKDHHSETRVAGWDKREYDSNRKKKR